MKIPLYRAVDKWIGTPLCVVFGGIARLFPKSKAHSPKRIAVLKLWAIGDSVVSLPMIRSLRQSFSEARIDVVTRKRNAAVFENSRDIDKLILFEWSNLPKILGLFKKYDLVIDAEPWMRLSALVSLFAGKRRVGFGGQARSAVYTDKIHFDSSTHMTQKYIEMAKAAGAKKIYDKPTQLEASQEDKQAVGRFLKENKLSGKLIGICSGGADSAPSRMWASENFAKLADWLVEKYGARIIFVGSTNDSKTTEKMRSLMRHRNDSVSAAGKLSLEQLFHLSTKFRLFVSNDTGPMHIAAAQGVPTVALFGSSNPLRWAPRGKGRITIYHKLPCSPCMINERGYIPDCLRKNDKYLCMKLITVDEVKKATTACLRRK